MADKCIFICTDLYAQSLLSFWNPSGLHMGWHHQVVDFLTEVDGVGMGFNEEWNRMLKRGRSGIVKVWTMIHRVENGRGWDLKFELTLCLHCLLKIQNHWFFGFIIVPFLSVVYLHFFFIALERRELEWKRGKENEIYMSGCLHIDTSLDWWGFFYSCCIFYLEREAVLD